MPPGKRVESINSLEERRRSLVNSINNSISRFNHLIATLPPQVQNSLQISMDVISAFSAQNNSNDRSSNRLCFSDRQLDLNFSQAEEDDDESDEKDLDETTDASEISDADVKCLVSSVLLDLRPFRPIDSAGIARRLKNEYCSSKEGRSLDRMGEENGAQGAVERALQSIAKETPAMDLEGFEFKGKKRIMVLELEQRILSTMLPESSRRKPKRKNDERVAAITDEYPSPPNHPWRGPQPVAAMSAEPSPRDETKEVEELLNKKSFKEIENAKLEEELLDLINRPTAREAAFIAKFKSKEGSRIQEQCAALTKEECRRQRCSTFACEKTHFRKIIGPHTDRKLGDCKYLDRCRKMRICKRVHYEADPIPETPPVPIPATSGSANLPSDQLLSKQQLLQLDEPNKCRSRMAPQWIKCDIRTFKMEILGQFDVIMADPPWDIHMDLPYGTTSDEEIRQLNVPCLQSQGLIFLWVTGRAMELGRELLTKWGYVRVDELIWVKTDEFQRLIRSGGTGRWLSHTKEHCLVGMKGNPKINRKIDSDVIVSEIREPSRKPDEMYSMIERVSPGSRKIELFARPHNTQPGWLSLGDQLPGVCLFDPDLRARFKAAYPDTPVEPKV